MQKIAQAENRMLFDIIKGLENEPTADVVPRSEVEKYIINMNAYGLTAKRLAEKNEILSTNKDNVEELQKQLNDYKKFVGEIRVTSDNHAVIIDTEHTEYIDKRVAEGLKNLAVKQSKQEVAREIFEEIQKLLSSNVRPRYYIDGILVPRAFDESIVTDLAELKKKYIGE